jgi:aspartate aminotransferase-like enzyme
LVAYPSQYQAQASFRVGCMGELTEVDIDHLVCTVRDLIGK